MEAQGRGVDRGRWMRGDNGKLEYLLTKRENAPPLRCRSPTARVTILIRRSQAGSTAQSGDVLSTMAVAADDKKLYVILKDEFAIVCLFPNIAALVANSYDRFVQEFTLQ